jgi:hypothetical protein
MCRGRKPPGAAMSGEAPAGAAAAAVQRKLEADMMMGHAHSMCRGRRAAMFGEAPAAAAATV